MPRRPVIRSNQHFYHVTNRSNNKEHFYVDLDLVWVMMTSYLSELQKEHDLKIGAFVLMNNHFHMLMMTPNEEIDRIMYFFMKQMTLKIQKESGRINKIFGGRYKGSLIETNSYLLNAYKYIYRNPVEAGITQKVEDYEYSTLFYRHHRLPIEVDNFSLDLARAGEKKELQWLNQKFEKDEAESIQCGLLRSVFKYKEDRNSRKLIAPEISL